MLSAPMGPIGILTVQRTLNNGRESGFFTGVGAAISDLFYCMLTGLGISMVTDFISTHENILQIVGSVLLIVYAIYMIIHKPVTTVKDDNNVKDDRVRDTLTGFLFTLSNPLIIFLVIPLFARFGFPLPEFKWYHVVMGYMFIVVGALLWWMAITYTVDKVRARFNIHSMLRINRVMGAILVVVAIYGLVTGSIAYLREIHMIA
jgi:threonine/homoserine/homoserine lactone efflux protein